MKIFISEVYKASLSKGIVKEYNKLSEAISLIPAQSLLLKTIDFSAGKVSVRDLVAYQIGWGTLLISWYISEIENTKPQMPGEGFTKWDYTGLAQHFYCKYQYDSIQEQIHVLHSVVVQILNIVEKEHLTGNLDKVGIWSWCTLSSGKQWPLSKWITVNTSAPYKRASALIRTFSRTISS